MDTSLSMDDRSLYTNVPATAATTAAEQLIVKISQEVLQVFPVGIQDNFIELGGTSMLAVRLAAQIEKEHGVHLSVESILDSDTFADIALELN